MGPGGAWNGPKDGDDGSPLAEVGLGAALGMRSGGGLRDWRSLSGATLGLGLILISVPRLPVPLWSSACECTRRGCKLGTLCRTRTARSPSLSRGPCGLDCGCGNGWNFGLGIFG